MTAVIMALTVMLGAIVVAGLILLGWGCWSGHTYFSPSPDPELPNPVPSVSILKPIEGAGAGTEAALESFCRLDYPGPVELLIGTIHPDDPVVPIVQRMRARYPQKDIRLIFAEVRGANRKTSIMEALWRKASGQFLFFSDGDVAAAPGYLRRLVPLLAEPDVGCLTCLPRGVQATTTGGKLVALHYGFTFLPQWMLALRTTGIHWAIGHTMAVRRASLERLNGFTGFLDHLADDFELGHRIAGLG
jgi:ceramide glucosyltransferase